MNPMKIFRFGDDYIQYVSCFISLVSDWLQDLHIELENKISQFHGREDTILYASCFDANAGLFEVLLSPEDDVFSDELNHASIIDGVRLCKASKFRYKHSDMAGERTTPYPVVFSLVSSVAAAVTVQVETSAWQNI